MSSFDGNPSFRAMEDLTRLSFNAIPSISDELTMSIERVSALARSLVSNPMLLSRPISNPEALFTMDMRSRTISLSHEKCGHCSL